MASAAERTPRPVAKRPELMIGSRFAVVAYKPTLPLSFALSDIDWPRHKSDPVTGLPSVLVPIGGVATLFATGANPVLQSGGWVGAARSHCRVAVQQQHCLSCRATLFAREMACFNG